MNEYDQARQLLESMGYTVSGPPIPEEMNYCAMCGMPENEHEDAYGWGLTPVEVRVNEGEEGASYVTRWYCDEHIDDVRNAFLLLGLGSHHHGSTTLIEADPRVCGGYGVCDRYEQSDDMEEVYRDGPLHAGPS